MTYLGRSTNWRTSCQALTKKALPYTLTPLHLPKLNFWGVVVAKSSEEHIRLHWVRNHYASSMHKTVSKDFSKLIHELIALSLYLQLSDMRTERTFENQDIVDISSTVSIRSVNVV